MRRRYGTPQDEGCSATQQSAIFCDAIISKEFPMAALTDTALCYQTIEDLKGRMQALKERL